ncbi:MAG: M14 family zinc carboxypeptidase, partial [Thermoanaerobaculia bacterium]
MTDSRRVSICCAALLIILAVANPGAGAEEVPTFAEVTGHDFGEGITVHHQMVAYLERLAETSPRVVTRDQGVTWEGRRLVLAIVTSPANHSRLDEIQANAQLLGDPRRTTPDEARRISAEQPAILYMGGSIHGFELSGAEGVLKLLQRLATAEDAETLEVLDNTVILLDPMLNPDGRDAFAWRNLERNGREPSAERDDWSNDFDSWEAVQFRTGHYFFDINRDWWAQTQRETRYRVPTWLEWRPQVVVDLHEMGPDVEFYFDPPAEPYGPFFPDFAREGFVRFGQAYAEAFDEAGIEYMTRERFNFFYPGYTTSFGSYQGAVGMLYEQGSTRGLVLERADESVRRLGDALDQHYTAAWTAAQTAARERQGLLIDYYEDLRRAVEDGHTGVVRYLLEPAGDPQLVAEYVNLLRRTGIEVGRLGAESQLGGVKDRTGSAIGNRTFPAGTYVVEAAQPHNRLLRALLEPDLPLPEDFLAEARAREDRGENPRFYDITAWSLPLLFDLAGYNSTDSRALSLEMVETAIDDTASTPAADAGYAYLIDGAQTASLAALSDLKDRGYR